jgi:hypothetical protein
MDAMFEKASRQGIRYQYKGLCTVEDLWDLSVQELDGIYKKLNKELKDATEESLLGVTKKKNTELELKVEIVKHIVQVKLAEAEAKEKRAARAQQKQKILGIIATKQDEALLSKSVEELTAMMDQDEE